MGRPGWSLSGGYLVFREHLIGWLKGVRVVRSSALCSKNESVLAWRGPRAKENGSGGLERLRKALATPGRPGVRKIAERFGVDPGTVQRISRPRPFADGAASVVV
jgi:hypothetical protein